MIRLLFCFLMLIPGMSAQQMPTDSPAHEFRISGVVVNATSGEKLAGSRVHIAPTTNLRAIRECVTGDDATFLFEHLPPGKYSLTASHRGYREQGYDQHENFCTAIVVGSGLESENLTFRLKADGEISGKVTDDGDPVPQGQVLLFYRGIEKDGPAIQLVSQSQLDDQGNYHFAHLLAGTFLVAVIAQPWYAQHPFTSEPTRNFDSLGRFSRLQQPVEMPDPKLDVSYPMTFYEGASEAAAATPIVVHAGEKYEANIAMHPVRALRMRVFVHVDDPTHPPNVSVMQASLAEARQFMSVNMAWRQQQGYYEVVGLAPGHFIVQVQSGPSNLRRQEIDLSGDADVNLTEKVVLSPISGMVAFQGADNTPLNSIVVLQNSHSGQSLSGSIKQDGTFSFQEPAAPGAYRVFVPNSEGYVLDRMGATGARVVGQTLEIKGSDSIRLSIVMSRQLGKLDGTAYLGDKPFPGAMIVLVPQDPAHNFTLFRRDQSDSDGTFTLPSIVPGKYTLVALRDAWDSDWSNAAVLSQYLAAGQSLNIAANGKYSAKVKVQALR